MAITIIKLEDKAKKLAELLKKPGDFVLFKTDADKNSDIHLAYFREVVFESPTAGPQKATEQNQIVEKKIKHDDYVKHFKENCDELTKFIRERLITLVGIDFDDTLTSYHTETKVDMMKKHRIDKASNRLFPQTTDAVIKKLLSIPNVKSFIATFNSSKVVKEHLVLWNLTELDIFALGGSNSKAFDKLPCFQSAFQTHIAPATECLDFSRLTQSNIDVISSYLVDDDEENNPSESGVNFIHACDKDTPIHLHELNKIFNLQINTDAICKNEVKPQKKADREILNITGKSLSFSDDEEPASPSKIYSKQAKRSQNFYDDSKHEENVSKKLFSKSSSAIQSNIETVANQQSSWINSPNPKFSETTNADDSDIYNTPLKVTSSFKMN